VLKRRLRGEVDRLNAVVTDLVDLARPKRTTYRVESLPDVVRRATAFFATTALKQGIELDARIADDVPPFWGSADQLYQVLLNLVHNALQALSVPGRIVIRCGREGEWIVVDVEDSGPGFAPEILPKAFTHFCTTKADGTGPGLAISRRIVEEHGKHHRCRERSGRGRTCAPLPARTAAHAPAMSAPMRQAASFADAALRRVLEVIDGRRPVAQLHGLLAAGLVDSVLSDLRMAGGSGLDLLDVVRRNTPDTPVILLTAYGTVETAVQAMQNGAFDYIQKPFDSIEMELRIQRALTLRRYRLENDYLREENAARSGFDDLIGVSPAIRRVFAMVQQVAPSEASILIPGETGTGKELLARSIHRRSPRSERLLVPVNLAAVPADLLESELFGHVRGAFTGAVAERPGKFELAHGGTLFLDEIGDFPLALQPKVLRVLQDGVVERVARQRREVDVRIISATNRDLAAAVASGVFRADLFYRLRVIQIEMPPLRERRDDIRYLVAHFLRKFGQRRQGGAPKITEPALRLLEEYPWPGNVRELENVLERAVVLCQGDTLTATLLNLTTPSRVAQEDRQGLRLDDALDRLEREMILRALDETKQVKARAARLLGVSERSLWYKLRKHDLS
jgi:two-component system response regulator AtoC